ncbi:TPA: hypothetical protein I8Y21_006231 [Klebsiella oxytoca]|uniref:Uncharacterized protein n=1 Tax=Klebsiella oxytoca TaxID=571 RepID=A0AAN5LG76_KLEOX|nr:hypothetical protein [Klebsiella oxytoca]
MIDASLINLPWATLVTLASGYIGYFIANVGLKDHHKPIDITFSTLIFGLFAAMVYQAFIWIGWGEYLAALLAVLYAFANGAWWRKYGRKLMYKFLRDHDISWSDSTSSAWQQMFGQIDFRTTELVVFLKNGAALASRDMGRFEGLANGPFTLGNQGDVILYVTDRLSVKTGKWKKDENVIYNPDGALATYVPADQIARLEIRRIRARDAPGIPS